MELKGNLWMRQMFDSASSSYVLLNRIITWGLDEHWREKVLNIIQPQKETKILDLCTGTGELAIKIARRFPEAEVYGVDFSPKMLTLAREKARLLANSFLIFKENNILNLDFQDAYFDYVTVSFGFRNLSYAKENLTDYLKEIYRVLKRDGKFVILETSQPSHPLIRKLFHFYAARIVPAVGKIFFQKKQPYAYLGRSIVNFFKDEQLLQILANCGFRKRRCTWMLLGAILLCEVGK